VVGSLPLSPGEAVVTTDHGYNACRNILDENAIRSGAEVVVASIPFPGTSPDAVFDAVMGHVTDATRLVVVDHVTSPTGLVFPVERIIAELEPEVPVLVDGAHAPGMLPLELDALGASFYAGNLHKWVCAAKGSAFLWVGARHRDSIQPTVISHGWNTPREGANRLHSLFDWTGTFDPSAWLSVPSALETMAGMDVGGWPGVIAANHDLALSARNVLCERLDISPPAPESMIGSMVALPLPTKDPALADRLRTAGIVTLVSDWPSSDQQVLRVSAQRYNTLDEYQTLATAILAG
jgi:isopenicillin-N epimerase